MTCIRISYPVRLHFLTRSRRPHLVRISLLRLRVRDRHGNCAGVVAAAQPEAVNMAGVRSADMYGLFIRATHQEQQRRRLNM